MTNVEANEVSEMFNRLVVIMNGLKVELDQIRCRLAWLESTQEIDKRFVN